MTEDEGSDASREGDPFDDESIGDADEIDDPFARLDEGESRGDADAEGPLFDEAKAGVDDRDPIGTGEDDAVAGARPDADAGRTVTDDPFDELGPATGETDADLDDAFERMDVGGVADEDVWESLDEDAAESDLGAGLGAGGGFGGAGTERVISKRTYCQQCPHFSAPPDVACDHEGTTIVEAVGFDEFRVRDCPMVDEGDPTFDAARDE